MIKHIIIWRLKESAHGNDKATNAQLIKERLEELNGKIPGLLVLEVGINQAATESSGDIALYSEFSDQQALDEYQSHALHKALMPFIVEARLERRVVDYEV